MLKMKDVKNRSSL